MGELEIFEKLGDVGEEARAGTGGLVKERTSLHGVEVGEFGFGEVLVKKS